MLLPPYSNHLIYAIASYNSYFTSTKKYEKKKSSSLLICDLIHRDWRSKINILSKIC